MLITMRDGRTTYLYDTETRSMIDEVTLRKHCLRFHIYDPGTGLATKKFSTGDRELQTDIIKAVSDTYGVVSHDNAWIKPHVKVQELWPLRHQEDRMVMRDLRSYWGDDVTHRGTSYRYIYYISDGGMSSTPDAIGTKFRYPLVYEGFALGTIFDIRGLDPLSPDDNVVYWLTKPMWEAFHMKRRGVPKDFPWPTGFIATHWCQRDGYANYGKPGIHIASMTQGQTVGSWSIGSLIQFWTGRQGSNIFSFRATHPTVAPDNNRAAIRKQIAHYVAAQECTYGLACISCPKCGQYLSNSARTCYSCETSWAVSKLMEGDHTTYCVRCGKAEGLCQDGDEARFVTLDRDALYNQVLCVSGKM